MLDRLPDDRTRILSAGMAGVLGALFSVALCQVVQSSLVQLSFNAFFAFYCGILFVAIGVAIISKNCASAAEGDSPAPVRALALQFFGLLMVTSGVVCVFMDRSILLESSVAVKLPIYTLLGTTISFALTFSFLDVANYCCGTCFPANRPLFETLSQVYILVSASSLLGFVYGLVFALEDVGSHVETTEDLFRELYHAERVAYPFGILIGAVAAAANQYLRAAQVPPEYAFDNIAGGDDDTFGI